MIVSIIIPCKDEKDNIDGLLQSISSQNIYFETEIIKIGGISPNGKARNSGAEKAKGDILVFLDNDVLLGHPGVLSNLTEPLIADDRIGVCGASQLIPKDANRFQQHYAKEVLHTEHPVVEEAKKVGMVGSACCAVRRKVFFEVGEFNDQLLRGIDVEFCYRVREKGYRVILVPQTWIYHPPPGNLWQSVKLSFRNGKATAFVDRYYPDLNFDVGTGKLIHTLERKSKGYRLLRYFGGVVRSIVFLKPINLISRITYIAGYFSELISTSKKNV